MSKSLLIISEDILRISKKIDFKNYDLVLNASGNKLKNINIYNYKKIHLPQSEIYESAYILSLTWIENNNHNFNEGMKHSLAKNLSKVDGIFYFIAGLQWIINEYNEGCDIIDVTTGHNLKLVELTQLGVKAKIRKIFHSYFSKITISGLQLFPISLINRIYRIFWVNKIKNSKKIAIVLATTSLNVLRLLKNEIGQFDIIVRDNVFKKRNRKLINLLNAQRVSYGLLGDYPLVINSFKISVLVIANQLSINTWVNYYKKEYLRKKTMWKQLIEKLGVDNIYLLEEFLDTANILNELKDEIKTDYQVINIMHAGGFYTGLTPVDCFYVFGEYYKRKLIECGNNPANIQVIKNPMFEKYQNHKKVKSKKLGKIANGKKIITYLSQYEKGASTSQVRLEIVKWMSQFAIENDLFLIIKFHPAEKRNIYENCNAYCVKGEFDLLTLFDNSQFTVTYYSFSGIESIMSGCPMIQLNPNNTKGLGIFDNFEKFNATNYQDFKKKGQKIIISDKSKIEYLRKQKKIIKNFFYF